MIQELNIQITNGRLLDPDETNRLVDDNMAFVDELVDYAKTASNIIHKDNYSVKFLFVGDDDKEKGHIALGFASELAYLNSMKKYGTRDNWKEFYMVEKDSAIIDINDITNLKRRAKKKHHIYFFDDIGYAYTNDEWARKSDLIMNNFFNPKVNHNNCTITTMRSEKWMGSNAEKLFNFHVDNPKMIIFNHKHMIRNL